MPLQGNTPSMPMYQGVDKITEAPPARSTYIWLYILGFFTGIMVTLTVTILVGWIINTAVPHSSWLNKAFYGYALGCSVAG